MASENLITRGDGAEQSWTAYVDDAIALDEPTSTPQRLARAVFVRGQYLTTPSTTPTPDLPTGRAGTIPLRRAARALVALGESTPGDLGRTWLILGLLHRYRHAREEETRLYLADVERAADLAADLDADLHGWALCCLATAARNCHDLPLAQAAAVRAVTVLGAAQPPGNGPLLVLDAALGGASWLQDQVLTRGLLTVSALGRLAIMRRAVRDYTGTIEARRLQVEQCYLIREQRPALYATTLSTLGAVSLDVGDVATALQSADSIARWVEESGSPGARRIELGLLATLARHADDWDEAVALRRERLRLSLGGHVPLPVEIAPVSVLPLVDVLRAASNHTDLTQLGNDALDLAVVLIDSHEVQHRVSVRSEARGWLDVAEASWQEIALNGKVAVTSRRAQLDAMEEGNDSASIGRTLLECSRMYRRPGGQRLAALNAADVGEAGDLAILSRLEELSEAAPLVDRARLAVGVARWHLRAVQAASAPNPARSMLLAVEHGRLAASGLLITSGGEVINLSPHHYLQAIRIQVEAMRLLRESQHPSTVDVSHAAEMAVRVASLPAVAQRFASSGSRKRREVLEAEYGDWLLDSLRLAVDVGDHLAADAAAEVLRRDIVGTILLGLSDDARAPSQIADLARRLTATLNAKVTDLEQDSGDTSESTEEGDSPQDPSAEHRAATVSDQLDETLDILGSVLGPVAKSMFDPRTVGHYTTESSLRAAYGDRRAAVLSLLLSGGSRPSLTRHLAWRAEPGGPIHHHLDQLPVPAWLPGLEIGDDPDLFWARLTGITAVLLPEPLRQLLSPSVSVEPLPLTIIPTGVLGIPFAALGLNGRLLLESAAVATAQSLQSAHALADSGAGSGSDSDSDHSRIDIDVAIYDVTRLTHTANERSALMQHRPGAIDADSLREIASALGSPRLRGSHGLLALAVHGTRGTDGWTQVKILPSGERLTTGHVLEWYVPRLVVGASCNTDIRADSGGELGGFPLAFQLRGATTIIGTLHVVEDEATAQIVSHLYRGLAAGSSIALALREAQLTWINEDRAHRLPRRDRWANLVCYGLP